MKLFAHAAASVIVNSHFEKELASITLNYGDLQIQEPLGEGE